MSDTRPTARTEYLVRWMGGAAHSDRATVLGDLAMEGWELIAVDGGFGYLRREVKTEELPAKA